MVTKRADGSDPYEGLDDVLAALSGRSVDAPFLTAEDHKHKAMAHEDGTNPLKDPFQRGNKSKGV